MMVGRVYVIMPVGSDARSHEKRAAISHTCSSMGLAAHFPMDRLHSGKANFPVDDILREIRGSSLVVADVSFERPSCYYELGLAESTGKRVLVIAEEGTDIHQTSHRSDVRFYRLPTDISHILIDANLDDRVAIIDDL